MNPDYATLFVFATLVEAEPFLARLPVTELSRHPAALYAVARRGSSRFLVLICGMGPAAAATALADVLARYRPRCILNCGVAGSLSDTFGIGEILQVSAVADTGANETPVNPDTLEYLTSPDDLLVPLPSRIAEARLVSQAVPVFDPERRAALSVAGDLIDMEGAAIAFVCRRHALRCGLIKVVSDHANDRATLLANLTHTSRRLGDFVTYYLEPLLQLESTHDSQRSRTA